MTSTYIINLIQNSSFVPITTKITAQDNGGSGLNNLQYQISDSTTLPTDDDPNWKTFTNESSVTENKTGGTWNGTTGSSTFTQNYASTKTIANPTAPTGYKVTFNGNGGSTPAAQNSTNHLQTGQMLVVEV